MTINKIIDRVLYENNKHWLSPEQAEWNIAEGRVPITRQDVHDIIKRLPIKIAYGENLHVEITDEGVIIKENKKESISDLLKSQAQDLLEQENKNLTPLDEHNENSRTLRMNYFSNEPRPNGIACPKCGAEMVDSNPMSVLTSMPPQKNVSCPECKYTGYRIA